MRPARRARSPPAGSARRSRDRNLHRASPASLGSATAAACRPRRASRSRPDHWLCRDTNKNRCGAPRRGRGCRRGRGPGARARRRSPPPYSWLPPPCDRCSRRRPRPPYKESPPLHRAPQRAERGADRPLLVVGGKDDVEQRSGLRDGLELRGGAGFRGERRRHLLGHAAARIPSIDPRIDLRGGCQV